MNLPPVATSLAPDEAVRAVANGALLRQLVAGFSIEATPQQLQAPDVFMSQLPAGTRVYVPYLPRAAMSDTVRACGTLTARGFRPVPHLAARALANRARLEDHLARLADAGAAALLLVAGDRRRAAGPFKSTLDVFDTGLLQRYGFERVAVAGHPEGHPVANDQELLSTLRRKSVYATETGSTMWIVTQFTFSATPVIRWLESLRAEGIDLPVRIGMPGPAKAQTLLRFALQCGVGASSRMLTRRPDAVTRLLGRWTPETMLAGLAQPAKDRAMLIDGIHVFPFGGLLKSIDFFTRL